MPRAYLLRRNHYCPTCIVNALTEEGRFHQWRRTHRLSDDPEGDLDSIASMYGIDRSRASSDFFPQPLWEAPENDPMCPVCLRWFANEEVT